MKKTILRFEDDRCLGGDSAEEGSESYNALSQQTTKWVGLRPDRRFLRVVDETNNFEKKLVAGKVVDMTDAELASERKAKDDAVIRNRRLALQEDLKALGLTVPSPVV